VLTAPGLLCVVSGWGFNSQGPETTRSVIVDPSGSTSLMYRLKLYLSTTRLGVSIDLTDLTLSMLYCAAYIAETYEAELTTPHIFVNVVCTVGFVLYFLLCLFLAPSRLHFLLSVPVLLDVLSVLPVVPLLLTDGQRTFTVQVMRIGVIARISHLEALDRLAKTDIGRQVFMCVAAACNCSCRFGFSLLLLLLLLFTARTIGSCLFPA
jgi:hypothetical protein